MPKTDLPDDVAGFLVRMAEIPTDVECGDPILADEFDEEIERARELCEKYGLDYYVPTETYDEDEDD